MQRAKNGLSTTQSTVYRRYEMEEMTSEANDHPALLERIMLMQALPEDAATRFLSAEGALATSAHAAGASPEATTSAASALSERLGALYGPIQDPQRG